MIDFIKVRLTERDQIKYNLEKQKKNHPLMGKYDHSNDIKQYPIISKRENIFIKVTEKSAYMENSLHKYFNNKSDNGNQNYNDFNFCEILNALDLLENELDCSSDNTSVMHLEFGFNIKLPINPTKFIKQHVLMENMKSPCYAPKNDPSKQIKKFTYDQYEIKVYNKSLHFNTEVGKENILRFEVKYKSKKILSKLGINNLNDLRNIEVYFDLFDDLMTKFDRLLILDSYNGNKEMSKGERALITKYTNPNFWIEQRENFSANTVLNRKKHFYKLIEKYGLNTMKNKLKELIIEKSHELIFEDCECQQNTLVAV